MKIILDTRCWLWWLSSPERLSEPVLDFIKNPEHEIYLSAASSWEIAIKYAIGKLPLPEAPAEFVPKRLDRDDIKPLPVHHIHALRVASLPHHHRDPFDRLLIAQAQIESAALLTADPVFNDYDLEIINPRPRECSGVAAWE